MSRTCDRCGGEFVAAALQFVPPPEGENVTWEVTYFPICPLCGWAVNYPWPLKHAAAAILDTPKDTISCQRPNCAECACDPDADYQTCDHCIGNLEVGNYFVKRVNPPDAGDVK